MSKNDSTNLFGLLLGYMAFRTGKKIFNKVKSNKSSDNENQKIYEKEEVETKYIDNNWNRRKERYGDCYFFSSYCSGEIKVCKSCGQKVCQKHSYNWISCHNCDN